mgnify:CR=1 FL=1
MKKVAVLLADGFEEIEALTVVDILRRASVYVDTVSITDEYKVRGSHGINVQTEDLFDEVDFEALTFLSYVTEGNEAVYTYYHDDGYEKDYENPAHLSEIRILPDGTVQR